MIGHGAPRSKVSIIPNGVDPRQFENTEVGEARRRLGIPAEGKYLLFIGSLNENKGVHLLLTALAALLRDAKLGFHTYIVGKGPLRRTLEESIARDGLQGKVTLVGEVDNRSIGDWYYSADVLFLGSSREGWPNVVCESLACGTPVIATPVNGIPELLASEEYGYIVERDPISFAHYITKAMHRNWNRKAIQRYGRNRTWDKVAEEVREVFFKTVRGHGAC